MRRLLIVVATATLFGCSDGSHGLAPDVVAGDLGPAFAAQIVEQYNEREEWTNVPLLQYNCSPPTELLSFTGIMHTVSMIRIDGSGVRRWSFHSHPVQATVVGMTSGREFKIVGAENTTTELFLNGQRHFHQTAMLRVMGKGAPTFTIRVLVDRTGPPPVFKLNRFEVECR